LFTYLPTQGVIFALSKSPGFMGESGRLYFVCVQDSGQALKEFFS